MCGFISIVSDDGGENPPVYQRTMMLHADVDVLEFGIIAS